MPTVGRSSLSGGQRQRLAIARALLKKPAILALDEATSSLDATSEHRVNDAIDKILRSRQTTCLVVAHRLSTIARAERIVVLEDGQIVESGTYRQLVSRVPILQRVTYVPGAPNLRTDDAVHARLTRKARGSGT